MQKAPKPRSISKNINKTSQIRNLVHIINELRLSN